MGQVLRTYGQDMRRNWRVLLILIALLFAITWSVGEFDQSTGLVVLAVILTSLVVALPLYLFYCLPFGITRMFILGAVVMGPVLAGMIALIEWLGIDRQVPSWASGLLAFAGSFGILMIPARIPISGQRTLPADNLLVFADGDLQTEVFRRIRPTDGVSFPDPMLLPAERIAPDTYLSRIRPDTGRNNGDQTITIVEEDAPNRLHLKIQMQPEKAKKPFLIDQRWDLRSLDDGAVQVSIRQNANWPLLTTLTMIVGDTIGDWLEAVLTWASGGDMRAIYGRVVNRRIAKAEARATQQDA